jgi:hypothetical protein
MHTTAAIAVGLFLLWLFKQVGQRLGLRPNLMDAAFTVLWLVACFIHGLFGVMAGYSIGMELAIGALVFMAPIAALVTGNWHAQRARPDAK